MSAPSVCGRRRQPRRTVTVLGKRFVEENYRPSYAIGIMCSDEQEQRALHRRLSQLMPGKEIKVLVI